MEPEMPLSDVHMSSVAIILVVNRVVGDDFCAATSVHSDLDCRCQIRCRYADTGYADLTDRRVPI